MSSDAILFFRTVPQLIFSLFTSFEIPGLGFTPATLMFGLLSLPVIKYVITSLLHIGENVAISHGRRGGDSNQ